MASGEPAGWANYGVLALRQRKLDDAAQRMERARKLAPDNDRIYQILGYLESGRGNSAAAIADWRKAVELNPKNYRAAYQLAEEVERQAGPNSDAEFEQLIQKILAAQPDNLAAQLELLRTAAKSGDATTVKSALAKVTARSANWPPEVKAQLAALQSAADGSNVKPAATRTVFLRNTLDARCGIPRKSRPPESARRRRGRTVRAFSENGDAGFFAGTRGYVSHLRCETRERAGREGRREMELGRSHPTSKRGQSGNRSCKRARSKSVVGRELSVPWESFGGAAARVDSTSRFQLRLQDGLGSSRRRAASASCAKMRQTNSQM